MKDDIELHHGKWRIQCFLELKHYWGLKCSSVACVAVT